MYMEQQQRLAELEADQNYPGEMGEDSEMTEDVDWFDFVVVEQIELYDDQEMTEQQNAANQNNIEQNAKKSQILTQQVKQHMQENEELKSMPDPSQIGAANVTEADGQAQNAGEKLDEASKMNNNAAENSAALPKGSALDPDMKVVKNYVRKTADDNANQDETQQKQAEGT